MILIFLWWFFYRICQLVDWCFMNLRKSCTSQNVQNDLTIANPCRTNYMGKHRLWNTCAYTQIRSDETCCQLLRFHLYEIRMRIHTNLIRWHCQTLPIHPHASCHLGLLLSSPCQMTHRIDGSVKWRSAWERPAWRQIWSIGIWGCVTSWGLKSLVSHDQTHSSRSYSLFTDYSQHLFTIHIVVEVPSRIDVGPKRLFH